MGSEFAAQRPLSVVPVDNVEAKRLRRAATTGPEGGPLDQDTEREISRHRGHGHALPRADQQSMGSAFGADFSNVRVHANPAATDLNNRIQAKAFTIGNDVFFRDGVPDTSSTTGQHLLAHELAHTVQNGDSVQRAIVRRALDKEQWARIKGTLTTSPGVYAALEDDDKTTALLQIVGEKLMIMVKGAKPVEIDEPGLLKDYNWPERAFVHAGKGAAQRPQLPVDVFATTKGKGFEVTELERNDLSLVHHTSAEGGKENHLTMENAHLVLMLNLEKQGGIKGFSKFDEIRQVVRKKPDFETDLEKDYQTARIDNINFYERPKPKKQQKKGAAVDPSELSLDTYIEFFTAAVTSIAKLPPLYGAEILRTTQMIAANAKLNLKDLVIRPGKGDENNLVRAFMTMHQRGLLPKLDLAKSTADTFKDYTKPIPVLYTGDDGTGKEIKRGEAGFTDRERTLVTTHFPVVVAGIKTFIKP